MIKEITAVGKTVEEAKENAIKELNASDCEDVQFELITMPKKKVLGLFGGCKAEVKAFVEVPDKKVKSAKKAVAKNSNSLVLMDSPQAAPHHWACSPGSCRSLSLTGHGTICRASFAGVEIDAWNTLFPGIFHGLPRAAACALDAKHNHI